MVQVNVKVPTPSFVKPPVVFDVAPVIVSVVAKVLTLIFEIVPLVSVMFLFVDAETPVYLNSPPPKTRLAAALVAFPKFPATSPLPMLVTLSVPKLMVTPPLKVFVPLKVQVLVPNFVKDPVPLITPEAVATPVPEPPKVAAPDKVIAPDAVAAVALLFTRDPMTVNSSAVVLPFKSTEAPEAIVVAMAEPKAVLLPNVK
jgi:hypothetical protein